MARDAINLSFRGLKEKKTLKKEMYLLGSSRALFKVIIYRPENSEENQAAQLFAFATRSRGAKLIDLH